MKLDFTMQDARFGALIAFAAVSEERSFTRAARRLHVSPSAVSQAVHAQIVTSDIPSSFDELPQQSTAPPRSQAEQGKLRDRDERVNSTSGAAKP
jgi:hypothetical protein